MPIKEEKCKLARKESLRSIHISKNYSINNA